MAFSINRRTFLALLASALAWCVCPALGQSTVPVPRGGRGGRPRNGPDEYALPPELAAFGLLSLVLGRAGDRSVTVPSVKELQSLVDYTRCPDTTQSAAIDPLFDCTQITNEGGKADYPFYWSGTTHGGLMGGGAAMYVAFGRAGGWMSARAMAGGPPDRRSPPGPPLGPPGLPGGFGPDGPPPGGPPPMDGPAVDAGDYHFVDVHGAGAQRSDPKAGAPARFPRGRGPQGDVIRINNFVRLVRTLDPATANTGEAERPTSPR